MGGTTSPDGDPYSEAGALEDHQPAHSFHVTEDDLEGPFEPYIAVMRRSAMDDKEIVAKLEEPDVGEYRLEFVPVPEGEDDAD